MSWNPLVPLSKEERGTCLKMAKAFQGYEWDGMRDHYSLTVEDSLWRKVSTDKANCLRKNCHYYRDCPFFIARREIENAEVVVSNHALVMAAMESDSVLPAAKDLLLVLDEGHHVPDVARDSLEMAGDISPAYVKTQMDSLIQLVATCMAQFPPKSPPRLTNPERLTAHIEEMLEQNASFVAMSELYLGGEGQESEYRFPMGVMPEEMRQVCVRLHKLTDGLRGLAEYLSHNLGEKTGKHDVVRVHQALLRMSRAMSYLESKTQLWHLAALEKVSNAPVSKWLHREYREGRWRLSLHCAGIRVCDQLDRLLWRNVSHVVLTSATLRSLNSYQRLKELSGLDEEEGDRFITLDSPFNHCQQGKLVIPKMHCEPLLENEVPHIAEIARFFRHSLTQQTHKGILVLFASQRAMQQFLSQVTDLRLMLLVQGDQPRSCLIALHRQRVEAGEISVLVGLQSFAEGLDLKGELLSQVHIHKIAFPPIDSPVNPYRR